MLSWLVILVLQVGNKAHLANNIMYIMHMSKLSGQSHLNNDIIDDDNDIMRLPSLHNGYII